ncbi:hypothetical protein [Arthrobacter sp. OY3WO11]|nr:hypothetical protein [Arthrobacter sp. OY3WO11]
MNPPFCPAGKGLTTTARRLRATSGNAVGAITMGPETGAKSGTVTHAT